MLLQSIDGQNPRLTPQRIRIELEDHRVQQEIAEMQRKVSLCEALDKATVQKITNDEKKSKKWLQIVLKFCETYIPYSINLEKKPSNYFEFSFRQLFELEVLDINEIDDSILSVFIFESSITWNVFKIFSL